MASYCLHDGKWTKENIEGTRIKCLECYEIFEAEEFFDIRNERRY